MFIYLLSLPIWNFVLPTYSFWHFDDFSWGDTRQTAGEQTKGADRSGHGGDGEFDSSQITMKRWGDFEQERRLRNPAHSYAGFKSGSGTPLGGGSTTMGGSGSGMWNESRPQERKPSQLGYSVTEYRDFP